MWDLIVSVPDHCLSFYSNLLSAVFKLWMLYFQRITLKIICLFKTNKHGLIDLKGAENIICTMMKYGEIFRVNSQFFTPLAMMIM